MRPHCPLLFVTALLVFSAAAPADNPAYASLWRDGDEKARAGKYDEALALFLKARDLAPNDPQIQKRVALAACRLKQRQLGLEAIDKVFALDPAMKDNPVMAGLRKELESLPAASPSGPKAGPKVTDRDRRLAVVTVQAICADIRAAADKGDADRAVPLAKEAKSRLRGGVVPRQ